MSIYIFFKEWAYICNKKEKGMSIYLLSALKKKEWAYIYYPLIKL